MSGLDEDSPTVIGGVGGSGTRLLAEILLELGFFLGSDLNRAKDNRAVTLLLKRPGWARVHSQHPHSKSVRRALSVLQKALTGCEPFGMGDLAVIARASTSMMIQGHDPEGTGTGLWFWGRLRGLRRCATMARSGSYRGWGWKEPNSHLFLPHLCQYFPKLRYIHMLRDGRDMAFSGNQTQLRNWGTLFGVTPPDDAKLLPQASLTYWVRANRKTKEAGENLLGDRFRIVRYEDLCLCPREAVNDLLGFLGIVVRPEQLQSLASIPQQRDGLGRHRGHDTSVLRPEDLNALCEFGYSA